MTLLDEPIGAMRRGARMGRRRPNWLPSEPQRRAGGHVQPMQLQRTGVLSHAVGSDLWLHQGITGTAWADTRATEDDPKSASAIG